MIKIPDTLRTERYYVAANADYAFSSWQTLEEAQTSAKKMEKYYPDDAEKIFGIVRVNRQGRRWE